jgi:pyruvate/2-oxoglutarate dehydrogenase complex dihydrolipoamide acyltransferase (E2) component
MARIAVEMPRLGLVAETARVARWLKATNDRISQGEVLLEVESDKAALQVEAQASGTLVEILVQADEEVAIGAPLAWIETH